MTTEADTPTPEPVEQAAPEAPEVPAAPEAPEPAADPVAADLAAFDKGMAEAAPEPPAEPEKPAEEAKPVEAATPETPKPAEPEKDEAAKAAEAVEAEITALGLKEKTAERFRELAKRPSEADVAPLREKAERADQWEQVIAASTAKPEQLSSALGYVQAINSGDPVAMGKAFDMMMGEVKWLAKQIGRELPGLVDPLADHADLKAEVEGGDLPRARALELARQRTEAARMTERGQRESQQREQQQAFQAAEAAAMRDIATLNAQLKATDPAFAQKLPLLTPTLRIIRNSLPPDRWAPAIRQAYAELPAIAVAPPPAPTPPVGAMPIRPTGANTQQRKPKNDVEAFEMGLATVAR